MRSRKWWALALSVPLLHGCASQPAGTPARAIPRDAAERCALLLEICYVPGRSYGMVESEKDILPIILEVAGHDLRTIR